MARPPLTIELKASPKSDLVKEGGLALSPVEHTASSRSKAHSPHSMPPRPRPFVFSAATLLEIPSRLARPPSVKSLGKRWTLVPEMSVSLEEILAMRHISPLSLKDFEQYLLFEEYGAENLYFILWLNDYTAQYHSDASSLHLSHSIARARATFFSSDSQYELNLAAGRVAEFYSLIGAIDGLSNGVKSPTRSQHATRPLHPDALAAIRADVEVMLRTSARRFVRSRGRNAGSQRAICVVFGGLLTMAVSLAPLMVSWFSNRSRWVRFGMIPPLWLGFTVFLCSVNGICLILYLMAGSRQLHPFELARPPISAPVPQQPRSPYQASFTTVDTVQDVKSTPLPTTAPSHSGTSFVQYSAPVRGPYGRGGHNLDGMAETYVLPQIRPSSPIDDVFEFETAAFIPVQDDSDTATVDGQSSTYVASTYTPTIADSAGGQTTSSSTKLAFDFDSLPAKTLDPASAPRALQSIHKGFLSKVFAPVTRVRSPVISRAQWEVVVRSMAVAALVALAISGILVPVPV